MPASALPAVPRVDLDVAAPGAEDALGALDAYVAALPLEPALLELVRLRASQINGCHVCLAMHARDARARGEAQLRLDALAAWREAPWYTARERAALAWTEAVTRVADGQVPEGVYEVARREFDAAALAGLTLAVVAINGWNRLAIALRMRSSISLPPAFSAT